MIKVLIIQNKMMHYRVAIFNELAKYVDLTVAYSLGEKPDGAVFNAVYMPTRKVCGKGNIHIENMFKFAKQFDVVIPLAHFSFFTKIAYMLPHKYKLIYWGIGVAGGYTMRYDSIKSYEKYYRRLVKKADAVIFYTDYPKKKYADMVKYREKMFVANNTVEVMPIVESKRDTILFVGTLYKEKKIHELLSNYLEAYRVREDVPKLVIVGDGDEFDNISEWIKENKLGEKVVLMGAIYDEKELSELFSKALICISPDQAGLTVLKSMGYAVPFVTHRNAITGGEIFNIQDKVTGILIDEFDEIKEIILDCTANPQKFIDMGLCAKDYYYKYANKNIMVQGFLDAINYTLRDKKKGSVNNG